MAAIGEMMTHEMGAILLKLEDRLKEERYKPHVVFHKFNTGCPVSLFG